MDQDMESGKPSLTIKRNETHILLLIANNFLFCSIGSIGQGHSKGTVTAVVLETAFLKNTTNGLRIKTWQVKSQFY